MSVLSFMDADISADLMLCVIDVGETLTRHFLLFLFSFFD